MRTLSRPVQTISKVEYPRAICVSVYYVRFIGAAWNQRASACIRGEGADGESRPCEVSLRGPLNSSADIGLINLIYNPARSRQTVRLKRLLTGPEATARDHRGED